MKPDPVRVRELFLAAVELPPGERDAFLDANCDFRELRAAVSRLLAAHDEPASVLERPAPGMPTADFTPVTERPGTKIGPYVLREQLGEGGFGLVFVAEQTEPVKRKVALKVIKPGMDTKHVIARFEQERQALALMDHPNIARVLDAGATETGRPYFVMELVRGIPITDYCDQNHLEPKERLELFVNVCHAIQHAHQKGIIHRDVKPSNVLVTSHDGKPVAKVIDFGVAKAVNQHLTERTIYTNFAQMIGTPLYMSPEQAEMSGLDVDTRSDIYSLGVLLYELLTGSTPLEKRQLAKAAFDEIRRLIREEEPPKPSQRISTCETLPSVAASRNTEPAKLSRMMKGELDWVVMKALEKDRTRRYETANALAKDVDRYLKDEPVEACPPSFVYRIRKSLRRNKGAVAVAGALALVMAIGFAGTAIGLRRALVERRVAEAQRFEAEEAAKAEAKAKQEALEQKNRAEGAEKRAIEETNAAKAVRDFSTDDLLRQADRMHQAEQQRTTGGNLATLPNPTVSDVLDRAAAQLTSERIDRKFPDMPLVQAEVLKAVGDAYLGLFKDENAESFLRRSHQILLTTRGPDDPLTLEAAFKLAKALRFVNKIPAESLVMFRDVHERRSRLFGPFDERTLDARQFAEIANLAVNGGKAGIDGFGKLKAEMTERFGRTHPQTVYATYFLGMAYRADGQLAKALAELDSLSLLTTDLGFRLDHPDAETAIRVHVSLLREAKRGKDAIALMEKALAIREQQQCVEIEVSVGFRHELGWTYLGENRRDDAFRVFKKNVEVATHPRDVGAHESYAAALRRFERYDEAIKHFQKALDLRYARNGAGFRSWDTGRLKATIGFVLMDQKKFAEAEPLILDGFKDYQDHRSQMPSYNHGHMGMAAMNLRRCYQALNKPDEAAKWYAEWQSLKTKAAETSAAAAKQPSE